MTDPCILPVTGFSTWMLVVAGLVLSVLGLAFLRLGARRTAPAALVVGLLVAPILTVDTANAAPGCEQASSPVDGGETSTTTTVAFPSPSTTTTTFAPPPPTPTTTTTVPPEPANAAPTFSAPASLTIGADEHLDGITADMRMIEISGFARDISPGDASESDQEVQFAVDVVGQVRHGIGGAEDPSGTVLIPSRPPTVSEDGTLSLAVAPYRWGTIRLAISATDSDGASSDTHGVTISVEPRGAQVDVVGDEGSECIPFELPPDLLWGIDDPQIVLSRRGAAILGRVEVGGASVGVGESADADLSTCFVPRQHRHSTFDPGTGTYNVYETFDVHIWTGRGDPITGELAPGAGATETSETFTISVVVLPVFG